MPRPWGRRSPRRKRAGAKSREVAIAISGDAAITKVIQMPRNLRSGDLESQVELQADQYSPFPWTRSATTSRSSANEKDTESNDVLLVATRTRTSTSASCGRRGGTHGEDRRRGGVRPRERLKLMTHQMPDGGIDRTIAVVDFGASSTTFSVLRNLKVVYTRDFAFAAAAHRGNHADLRPVDGGGGRSKKEGGLRGTTRRRSSIRSSTT